jgi:hypothetical protein
MGPSNRPDHHINLNYLPQLGGQPPRSGSSTASTSPVEPTPGSVRFPVLSGNASNPMANPTVNMRLGAGSPSHEFSGRLYSKRLVFCLFNLMWANHVSVHGKYKLKKGLDLRYGARQQAAAPRRFERRFQSHLEPTAFQILIKVVRQRPLSHNQQLAERELVHCPPVSPQQHRFQV